MIRRRPRSVMIVLLLALGGQIAYATPVTATAVARALTYCAAHGHPVSPATSGRCCHVLRQIEDPALTPSASGGAPAGSGSAAVLAAALPSPFGPTAALPQLATERYGVGPPLYLQVCTLRL